MTNNSTNYDAIFSGVIGQEYELLKLICPLVTEMSRLVGLTVKEYSKASTELLSIIELGGGTGITTLSILDARDNIKILSVDSEPVMQNQAKTNLNQWVVEQKLAFCGDDALTALKNTPSQSIDIVASAYTLHNFLHDYREQVIHEIYRVLKPDGQFINGDRYALDDVSEHTRTTQHEVTGYFKVLTGINRLDLLEHWIVHLFSDESENHVMRETISLNQLKDAGFVNIQINHRNEVNALVTAIKPRT
ncbi:MAG: class I SAM-dependent methyltransferase [Methylococcales bacterium]|nr:class I SAM-dependent methyltransferase [Methylococcaceae bacterium]